MHGKLAKGNEPPHRIGSNYTTEIHVTCTSTAIMSNLRVSFKPGITDTGTHHAPSLWYINFHETSRLVSMSRFKRKFAKLSSHKLSNIEIGEIETSMDRSDAVCEEKNPAIILNKFI